jgi:methenyltetrahydromethanopterin cyclohydrolase
MKKIERASVNGGAMPLVRRMIADAAGLRVGVERAAAGHALIDAGISCPGGLEAGLRVAEICLGGLGRVTLQSMGALPRWPWTICVSASDPVLACLGSQYAGWQLSAGQGADGYMALGSGPARALAVVEPLFEELNYRDTAAETVLVLEVDKPPPAELIEKVARACGVAAERLTVIMTPTKSLAGTVQIVARSLEVALHKAHEIGFPLDRVVDGMGAAPLPPPAPDFIVAMGRTNDAIIYGGDVQLFVRGADADAKDLAERLPSRGSRDYGRPFAEIFAAAKGDFYAIDRLLFSPARVTVTAVDSGRSFRAGAVNEALVDRSFGGGT